MGERRGKPARGKAFGILNPWGDVWTHETFDTEERAAHYVVRFWRDFPGVKRDTSQFKVVPVKVTVSIDRAVPIQEGDAR